MVLYMQDSGLNIFMPKGAMNCEKLIFAGYTNNHRVCHIGFMAPYCFSHPVSGVFLYIFYAPVGVLFVFRGKPSNMSQTENSAKPKGEFFMMTAITTLLKNERGYAYEEIEKQNIIYGA